MMTDSSPYKPPEESPETAAEKGFLRGIRRLSARLEVNATVLWAIMTRSWQIVAGAVSFFMIASYLSPVEQGFYAIFWSFIALQSLMEVGFTIAILNFSSHEWAQLQLGDDGRIQGSESALSRLVSLGRIAFLWFGIGALLFIAIAGISGDLVLSAKSGHQVDWRLTWWTVVGLSALSLWNMPFLTMLEGCGQIQTVYRFRFFQAVLTNLAVWLSLWYGFGLWTVVVSAGTRLVLELFLVGISYRRFFEPFLQSPKSEVLKWRDEIWPMQWRLAVGGGFNYFAVFMFSPIMAYHSLELAGQMGMTRQLLMALQSAAQAWVQARVPMFGQLVAKRSFTELDSVFRRLLIVSTLVLLAGGIGFILFLFGLEHFRPRLASRLLGPVPSAIMLLAMLLFQLPYCQTLYLRAHRKEPVMWQTVASNLGIAVGVALLGTWYADTGAALGHLLAVALITVPLIHRVWVRCRHEWHAEPTAAPLEQIPPKST
jgi:O-antigen/teichoic acid export membrane protein